MTVLWIALAVAAIVLFVTAGATLWLVRRSPDEDARALIRRIMRLPLRDKARLAVRLARDARIPLPVRAIPPALILYLATPVDLIPDFIPVLGHVDDLIVALIGVALLLRFAPRHVLEDQLARLEAGGSRTAADEAT